MLFTSKNFYIVIFIVMSVSKRSESVHNLEINKTENFIYTSNASNNEISDNSLKNLESRIINQVKNVDKSKKNFKFTVNVLNRTTRQVIQRVPCTDKTNLKQFTGVDIAYDVVLSGGSLSSAKISKCCPAGRSYIEMDGKYECVNSNSTFKPIIHVRCGLTILAIHKDIPIPEQNPCSKQKYTLDPSEEKFFPMFDGTLDVKNITDGTWMRYKDPFCLESFVSKDSSNKSTSTLLPFICINLDLIEAGSKLTVTLYAVAMLVSVPFLLATLFVFAAVKHLRNAHGEALCCHVICLCTAFIFLASVQLANKTLSRSACIGVAFIIHVSFVACFFWLSVMCYESYITTRDYIFYQCSRKQDIGRFVMYCAIAWGCPTVLILFTLFFDFLPIMPSSYIKPNTGLLACQFQSEHMAFPYFYFPIGLLILLNIVFLTMTWIEIRKYKNNDERFAATPGALARFDIAKSIFAACIILSIIMTINWVVEVISWKIGGALLVWSVFDIFNALQGLIIFGIFVLQRNDRKIILKEITNKLSCCSSAPVKQSELIPLS